MGLFDACSIIVGTIIGAGIFKLAPEVAANAGSFPMTIAIWITGGAMAMSGAVCFAELATRFPGHVGGDYVYLKSAYGKPIAFMFAWTAFWIIRPGNICVMALVFAEYFTQVTQWSAQLSVWIAVMVIVLLTFINLAGLSPGTLTQNVLTLAKVAGIGCVIALPFLVPIFFEQRAAATALSGSLTPVSGNTGSSEGSILMAIVFVMFTMGGWNDIALVAGEIKPPKTNLYKSLVFGTLTVTGIYLLFNVALYVGLGFDSMSHSKTVATELVQTTARNMQPSAVSAFLADYGSRLVAALVCLSCLGAINGMILTSPRIYYSVGRDFSAFGFLARWNESRNVPWQALTAQAIVTITLILITLGRANGVEAMVSATTPYFFGFFALTAMTLIVFRVRDNAAQTSSDTIVKMPLYPLPLLVFLGVCGLMCYTAINYVIFRQLTVLAMVMGGLMAIGAFIAVLGASSAPE